MRVNSKTNRTKRSVIWPMPEEKRQEASFREAAAKIANRILDNYIGDEKPKELKATWRILCSFAGTSTMYGFGFITSALARIEELQIAAFTILVSSFIAAIVTFLFPFLVAVMIAYSIKKGTPLRFFLVGFLLSAGLLNIIALSS